MLQAIDNKEHLKIIERLLTTNIDINIAITNSYNNRTTLQAIANKEYLKIIERLLIINVNVIVIIAANYNNRTIL